MIKKRVSLEKLRKAWIELKQGIGELQGYEGVIRIFEDKIFNK